MSGDEVRIGVQSLAKNHEIEVMSSDRVISIPTKYGRDFTTNKKTPERRFLIGS